MSVPVVSRQVFERLRAAMQWRGPDADGRARETPRSLLPPALEGAGLDVRVHRVEGWLRCPASWWRAAYLCPAADATTPPVATID